MNNDEILVNGQVYTKKPCDRKYVVVRTYSAGVFAGYLEKKDGKEVELSNARRIWFWSGAASLSELSMKGVSRPNECKFPCEVSRIVLTECIEILDTTEQAKNSIKSVPIWTAHE